MDAAEHDQVEDGPPLNAPLLAAVGGPTLLVEAGVVVAANAAAARLCGV